MAHTKTQKFAVEQWTRSDIKGAPYNPRTLNTTARKKLEKNLRNVGLLIPVVVNRRTGNLVSGHQRLACVDAIEGSGNYTLDVSVVDLTPKQEQQQNIFFNNPAAQGTWDIDRLADVLRTTGLELDATGFDVSDLQLMFDDELVSVFKPPEPEEVKPAAPVQAQPSTQAPNTTEPERPARTPVSPERRPPVQQDAGTFMSVVVFQSREQRETFCRALGRDPDDRYIDGKLVAHKLGIEIEQA